MNNSDKIMKNFYKTLIMIVAVAFMTFACEDDDPAADPSTPSTPAGLTISEADRQQSFGQEAESKTVSVTAGGMYSASVESGKDWCTVSGISSTGFKINVAENTGVDARTASITVSMPDFPSIVVAVTQIGSAPSLIINDLDRNLLFPAEEEDLTIAVTTNGEYTATVESGKDWITVSDKTAKDFKVSVAANSGSEERTATITVSRAQAPAVVITVTQKSTSLLEVGGTKALLFNPDGGDSIIAVRANGEYYATVDEGNAWCTISDVTETSFTIKVAANAGFDGRTTKVIVSRTQASSDTITVTQTATPVLEIDSTTFEFDVLESSATVDVVANGEYSVAVEDGKDWVTVSDITAKTFKINVAGNPPPGSEERTATVTVSRVGTPDIEITVHQIAISLVLSVEQNQLILNSGLDIEQTITVLANTPVFVYTAESDQSWVSLEQDGASLKLKIDRNPNATASAERTAKITIRSSGAEDLEVDITQLASLDKSLMGAHYVGDDNRTLWGGQSMALAFDNVSPGHGGTTGNIYCTTPNTDGTDAIPPAEGSTAWTFPFYFTMDLGAEYNLNSFRITPRCNRSNRQWEFRLGSPYKYEIYGTNEDKASVAEDDPYWNEAWLNDWEYLGEFTNHNPSGLTPETITAVSDISEADANFAAAGYDFTLPKTTKPVRYLRFKINEVWEPGTTYVHFQELWFWGQQAE
jgi:hypothetical protein